MSNETQRPTRKQVYSALSKLDISRFVEVKDAGRVKLDYLSWAAALHILNALFDDVQYEVVRDHCGRSFHACGTGAEVRVKLSIEGHSHTEVFPIMNNRMQSKAFDEVDARDVSDSVKRGFVKAAAHFGLGLSLYVKMAALPNTEDTEHALQALPVRINRLRVSIEKAQTKDQLRSLLVLMARDERQALEAEVKEKAASCR